MSRPLNANRAAARLLGDRHYIGSRCKRGHSGRRFTSTGACTQCGSGRPVPSESL